MMDNNVCIKTIHFSTSIRNTVMAFNILKLTPPTRLQSHCKVRKQCHSNKLKFNIDTD